MTCCVYVICKNLHIVIFVIVNKHECIIPLKSMHCSAYALLLFIIYTGHTSGMNIDWYIIVQYTVYIYYIICKVTISLSLFRHTFVHSIRSVYFLRTEVPETQTRIHILSHGVINRTVTYKEKNECVKFPITIADSRRSLSQVTDEIQFWLQY